MSAVRRPVEASPHPSSKLIRCVQNQHKHYNTLLNELKTSSDLPTHPSSPLNYSHLYLIDSFYTAEHGKEKIRVTRDEKTGVVTESVRKVSPVDQTRYKRRQ